MSHRNEETTAPADRELMITREYPLPRERMFELWTREEHLLQWWAPRDDEGRDFTTPTCDVDVREGGRFRIVIRSPDGTDYVMRGIYREVVEPERLAFTFAWEGDDGEPGHETLVTVLFNELDGGTEIRFHQAVFESVEQRDSHEDGWSDVLDRLGEYVDRVGDS